MKVLREAGHMVYATDLVDYGQPQQDSRVDFLMEYQLSFDTQCIVTNPPYALAEQFVRHALDLAPKVVMLLRLMFLEGTGRDDVLNKLSRVYVFKNRLPRMHREGWTGKRSTSSVAFAWFVWDRTYIGPPLIQRISWEKE